MYILCIYICWPPPYCMYILFVYICWPPPYCMYILCVYIYADHLHNICTYCVYMYADHLRIDLLFTIYLYDVYCSERTSYMLFTTLLSAITTLFYYHVDGDTKKLSHNAHCWQNACLHLLFIWHWSKWQMTDG